jgi:hypothetical protein
MASPQAQEPTLLISDDLPPEALAVLEPDELAELERSEAEELMGATDVDREQAVFPAEGIDTLERSNDTRTYEGEPEPYPSSGDESTASVADKLELLETTLLRGDETDDPNEAAEEGLTWVPPIDPPVHLDSDGESDMTSGLAGMSLDQPDGDADDDGSSTWGDDDTTARIRDALAADALASAFVDDLRIESDGTRVRILGEVDDLDDEEQVVAIASAVPGVEDILNGIRVRAIE